MSNPRAYKVPVQEVPVSSAARTTNGNSAAVTNWRRGTGAQTRLTITANSGTAQTLNLFVEDSQDGSSWAVRDTYPAQTGNATVTRSLPNGMDKFQRFRWTITGTTPSFTFTAQFGAQDFVLT